MGKYPIYINIDILKLKDHIFILCVPLPLKLLACDRIPNVVMSHDKTNFIMETEKLLFIRMWIQM
jgi:hypothetical protein